VALRILAGCAVIAGLYFAAPLLLPFIISVFLFYALDPIVDQLEAWKLPRAVASTSVVLTFVAAVGASGFALWPQIEAVVVKVPEGVQQLRATLRQTREPGPATQAIKHVQEAAEAIDRAAAESSTAPVTPKGIMRVEVTSPWRTSDWIWSSGVGALELGGQALAVLFLTIFLLNEDDSFKRKLVRQMETRGDKRLTVQILNDIATQMEKFIWVQVMTSAGVAVATGLALAWLGLEQAAVWGAFAGLMNIVPFFGPLIVTVAGQTALLVMARVSISSTLARSVNGVMTVVLKCLNAFWMTRRWSTDICSRINCLTSRTSLWARLSMRKPYVSGWEGSRHTWSARSSTLMGLVVEGRLNPKA
jgi:predicted PurR-regulated permease PerM